MSELQRGDVALDLAQDNPHRDPDVLETLYVDERLKTDEVAEVLDCAKSTVIRWMDKHGIERRDSNAYDDAPWRDREVLERLYYDEGLKQREIADKLDCDLWTVEMWCSRYDVGGRDNSDYAARRPASFYTERRGYEVVSDNHDRLRLHRLLAVAEYGVDAVAGKVVHHRNHIPWDNRPKNIELLSNSEHMTYHGNSDPSEVSSHV